MKVLQIHPTLKCSNGCKWCPYVPKDIELPLEKIANALFMAFWDGCDILKISGGGEPLEYPYISLVLSYAKRLGFKVYLQTNGKRLNNIIREAVDDIRISLGDGKRFTPPRILPNGFSYVVSENPDYDNLNELLDFAIWNNCYVRITQDDRNIKNVPSVEEIQANIGDFSTYVMPQGCILRHD